MLKTNNFYMNNKMVINENEITCGATMFGEIWYTNFNDTNIIDILEKNTISLYIPSTINVNEINKNFEKLTLDTMELLKNEFHTNINRYDTKGAWRAEDGTLVFENINILSINNISYENFENTLNYFIKLANRFKIELSQEGISIGINDGLMII